MGFEHISDTLLRYVLQGNVSEIALRYAIDETLRHAMADQANEDVPYAISEKRLALAYDAADWWDKKGNAFQSVECLRLFWAI